MPATTTAAERLRVELAAQHARFSPVYNGYLSDHGPMAALALAGLGNDEDPIIDWLRDYRQRLAPLSTAPPEYRRHLSMMQEDVIRLGSESLLERELPALVSGWARHAYHPLIRTAYGYAFDVQEEVAAGLAYLGWLGADPAIAATAGRARRASHADAPFRAMRACATQVTPGRRFDDCLTWVSTQTAFREVPVVLDDPLEAYSRRGLAVFDATHDFFALHLVTGAHAFRVLYEFAGADRQAVFALGMLAGYACVGAPDYPAPDDQASAETPSAVDWLDLGRRDEHRIKIAYSAVSQSAWFSDPEYARIAFDYLSRS